MSPTRYGRTLDYVPRLVDANLNHLIRDTLSEAQQATLDIEELFRRSRWWTGGAVLDQGREGSCVGHGVVGEWMASPVRGRPVRDNVPGPYFSQSGHEEAVAVYNRAKEIDEWEGINYDGTSVRAGLLVGRDRGWWTNFKWAKDLGDLRLGLEFGPVVIGVTWYEGMYDTDPNGLVDVSGPEVGGHCLIITGFSKNLAGHGPHFRWRNSWGPLYGRNGNGYITPQNLKTVLFDQGNEAAIVSGRHL